VGAADNETWPVYLQKIMNEKITGKNIEVINFGLSGATTESYYELIKNRMSSLDPDLIIMYDGWNDKDLPTKKTIQNWESACKLGKNEGFDAMIVVQSLPITGQRVTTEQQSLRQILRFSLVCKQIPNFV
jgi:lysophospholipase L1-like esterase